ncbi:hypothetical protein PFISCL1PPCAC_12167, partial [Pristionchus fissidentatus]
LIRVQENHEVLSLQKPSCDWLIRGCRAVDRAATRVINFRWRRQRVFPFLFLLGFRWHLGSHPARLLPPMVDVEYPPMPVH